MAVYPGAIYKPITAPKGRRALTVHNRANLHVAVSEGSSLFGVFNLSGKVDSHFYIRKDGTVEQYVDTSLRAFADLDGNDGTVSIETQGGVNNPQGEPWTEAQLVAIASLVRWLMDTHGIQRQLATSSRTDSSSRGLSWHRLGVDGTFPASPSILAGRLQRGGGMHYSKSRGKICPGDAKINQIPGILSRVSGVVAQPAPPAPAPKPSPGVVANPASGNHGYSVAHMRNAQTLLNRLGNKLVTDGIWGPATAAATTRFQAGHGLATDGIPGPQTVKKMQDVLARPAPAPASPSKPAGLVVDGYLGRDTIRRWQQIMGTPVDGTISPNSQLIRKVQQVVGVTVDGTMGPQTIRGIQRHLGTPVDGVISRPSQMVMALQRRLNEGRF